MTQTLLSSLWSTQVGIRHTTIKQGTADDELSHASFTSRAVHHKYHRAQACAIFNFIGRIDYTVIYGHYNELV